MTKTPIQYDREKYEHELEGLKTLLVRLNYEYPSIEDIIDWVRDRMETVQEKINECDHFLDNGGEDE